MVTSSVGEAVDGKVALDGTSVAQTTSVSGVNGAAPVTTTATAAAAGAVSVTETGAVKPTIEEGKPLNEEEPTPPLLLKKVIKCPTNPKERWLWAVDKVISQIHVSTYLCQRLESVIV